MTFSIDNPRGLQQPPLGKYVWEKPSGEQGLCMWSGIFSWDAKNWQNAYTDPQIEGL